MTRTVLRIAVVAACLLLAVAAVSAERVEGADAAVGSPVSFVQESALLYKPKNNGKRAPAPKRPVPYTNVLKFPSQQKKSSSSSSKKTSNKVAPVPKVGTGALKCSTGANYRKTCKSPAQLGTEPYNLGIQARCVCTDTQPSNVEALHRSRGPKLVRQLMAANLGLTQDKAIAIVANMFAESPGIGSNRNEDKTGCFDQGWTRTTAGRCGFGWVQWTAERRTAYFNYCAKHRLTPGTDRSNWAYLIYEFQNPYEFVRNGRTLTDGLVRNIFRAYVAGTGAFANCRTLTCLANKWRDEYERPSAAAVAAKPNERANYATQLLGWVQADARAGVRTTLF